MSSTFRGTNWSFSFTGRGGTVSHFSCISLKDFFLRSAKTRIASEFPSVLRQHGFSDSTDWTWSMCLKSFISRNSIRAFGGLQENCNIRNKQESIPVGCVPPACRQYRIGLPGVGNTSREGVSSSRGVSTPPVDRKTPVKTLPSRNFVCGR